DRGEQVDAEGCRAYQRRRGRAGLRVRRGILRGHESPLLPLIFGEYRRSRRSEIGRPEFPRGSSRSGESSRTRRIRKPMAAHTRANVTAEAVVVGAGPAGLTAAIALAVGGIETVLVAKRPERPDNRTSALLPGSVAALEVLGAWEACRAHAAPLRTIRLVDDTRRLLRAPEVSFSADEIDLDAFGHNIENRHLVVALEARAGALAHLVRIDAPA